MLIPSGEQIARGTVPGACHILPRNSDLPHVASHLVVEYADGIAIVGLNGNTRIDALAGRHEGSIDVNISRH
jgi:hypothetical protein